MDDESKTAWKQGEGEKLHGMHQVFYCASLVADFDKRRRASARDEDFKNEVQWSDAIDRARDDLRTAISDLPEDEREKLVAMYETLRHWAYQRT